MTCATILLERGKSLKLVADQLGHSSNIMPATDIFDKTVAPRTACAPTCSESSKVGRLFHSLISGSCASTSTRPGPIWQFSNSLLENWKRTRNRVVISSCVRHK